MLGHGRRPLDACAFCSLRAGPLHTLTIVRRSPISFTPYPSGNDPIVFVDLENFSTFRYARLDTGSRRIVCAFVFLHMGILRGVWFPFLQDGFVSNWDLGMLC